MSLKLRDIDTNTPHIENLTQNYNYIFGGRMSCTLSKADIKCSNEEKILDAFHRKGKQHFQEINRRGNHLIMQVTVRRRYLIGPIGAKQIEDARKNLEEGVQNTVDDVFGVGCVEVE